MRSATHPCRSLSNCGREDEAERGIMLQDTRTNSPSRQVEMAEHEAAGPSETVKLTVVNLSDEETSASSSDSEDQTFVEKAQSTSKSSVENLPVPAQSSPTKVLFLDGIRGVAAMMVVVQHSHEFEPNLHLGSVAVDAFFILSSFLLTWLFMKKSMKLLAQGAGARAWMFALVDYFQKRFFRVYPLFAVTVFALSCMSFENQHRYFNLSTADQFDTFKALTFDSDHRYHVFWTLPLEISYYFVIPVFVLVTLRMRRFWWMGAVPLLGWIIYEGFTVLRTSHQPLRPHLPTFLLGSLAAVVFVKLDLLIKTTGFQFRLWHTVLVRIVQYFLVAMFFSVSFRALLFDWVFDYPLELPVGFPFVNVLMAAILLIEILHPSCISPMFEWSVFRYWGKISFSIYLLHVFVINYPAISHQSNYFNRLFARLFVTLALATTSYHLIEYPSQLMAQRISRFLAAREKNGSGSLVQFTCMEKISLRKQRSTMEVE